MRILAATDFSSPSKAAVFYAAHLAVNLKAGLVLLNVVQIEQPVRSLLNFTADEILKKLENESMNECIQLIEEVRHAVAGELKIEYAVESGGPVDDTVNNFALKHGFDLIVMGTQGATGLKKVVYGGTAASVISGSVVPVLTVPGFTNFHRIDDLVYASDMSNIFEEFKIILPLARIFNSTVHLVHVYRAGFEPRTDEITMSLNLQKGLNYPKIDCHYMMDNNVRDGIERYLERNNGDILAMFAGERSFLEKLFGKSSTREMVFRGNTPLLTFRK